MQERVFQKLDSMKDEAVSLLRTLLSFESVDTPANDPAAPHGTAVAACLSAALTAAKEYGLAVRDLDGEAGLIDSDEGIAPKIGMLCHLDIVPTGTGWTHDPLAGEIEDGKLFGRGTSDDKGPFVSALLALAAIKACDVPLNYPIRLIAGTCEETGSRDIAYCKARGVIPPYVFSPDANYPVVNTEKGMARFSVSATLPAESALVSLSGGEALNMVPQRATATFKDGTKSEATGKSAHASTPELGENAVSALLETLCKKLVGDGAHAILKSALDLHPPHVTDGSPLGIEASDEISGSLTCSLGLATLEDGVLTLSFDVRHPLCTSAPEIREKLEKTLAKTPFSLTKFHGIPPHHVAEDSPFVQSLLSAYTEVTGLEGYCIAIGGGTYVHDIDGGVAFGTCFPNRDCRIHSPDEFIPVEDLILNAKIFVAALLKLQDQTL